MQQGSPPGPKKSTKKKKPREKNKPTPRPRNEVADGGEKGPPPQRTRGHGEARKVDEGERGMKWQGKKHNAVEKHNCPPDSCETLRQRPGPPTKFSQEEKKKEKGSDNRGREKRREEGKER